jgi:hypothetical protein
VSVGSAVGVSVVWVEGVSPSGKDMKVKSSLENKNCLISRIYHFENTFSGGYSFDISSGGDPPCAR